MLARELLGDAERAVAAHGTFHAIGATAIRHVLVTYSFIQLAVATTAWMILARLSTPIWAFMPKYH